MLIYLSLFICSLYSVLILVFIIGWSRNSIFVPSATVSKSQSITVIVACKNESLNLPRLLSCLAQQSYQEFELILVNDHSSDNTLKLMKGVEGAFMDLKIIDAQGNGKKMALKEAIESAKGNLIVTTDADCVPSYHWLETISCFYKKRPADLIICPIRLTYSETLFLGLQILEFTSLVASGAAAAGVGMPILCNGANLAFTKKAWLESKEDLRFDKQSGDDIFLLQSIKKRGGTIRFLKSESAFVATEAATTLPKFFSQRERWASKAPAYTDWQLIFTACIVLAISVLEIVLLFLALNYEGYWKMIIGVAVGKYLVDITFLYTVQRFFQLQYVWFNAFFLSLGYPFYIVLVSFKALLFKQNSWK